MTTHPGADTLQSVIVEFIDALGAKECARLIGKAEYTIYKARNLLGGYMIPHEDFLRLDAAVAAVRGEASATPYQLFVARRVRAMSGIDGGSATQNLIRSALDVGAAVGALQTLVGEVTDASGPAGDHLSPNEREVVRAAIVRVQPLLVRLEHAVARGEMS